MSGREEFSNRLGPARAGLAALACLAVTACAAGDALKNKYPGLAQQFEASFDGELNPQTNPGCVEGDLLNPCYIVDITTANDRTAVCHYIPNFNWAYRANSYLLTGNFNKRRAVAPRTGQPGQLNLCQQYAQRGVLVDGEYALTGDTKTAFATLRGDACAPVPTVVIHRFEGDWLLQSKNPGQYQNRDRFTNPLYEFYVGAHNTGWIRGNKIDARIIGMGHLVAKQCGRMPDRIRVIGVYNQLPELDARRNLASGSRYRPIEIYAGTYYPKATGYELVPDDAEIAADLRAIEQAYHDGVETRRWQAQERFERRTRQATLGGLLVALGAYAGYESSPCNDVSLAPSDKPAWCQ